MLNLKNVTLFIECILVLSKRVWHLEILIWDPRFLGDFWSARISRTFEPCLCILSFVHPSVVGTIAFERKKLWTSNFADRLILPIRWLLLKMRLCQSIGSGTSHIFQTEILRFWAHGKSDSHQIWYLSLCTNSWCVYWKLLMSVDSVCNLTYVYIYNWNTKVLGIAMSSSHQILYLGLHTNSKCNI